MPTASTRAVSATSSCTIPATLRATKVDVMVPLRTLKGMKLVIPPRKRPKPLPASSADQPDGRGVIIVDMDDIDASALSADQPDSCGSTVIDVHDISDVSATNKDGGILSRRRTLMVTRDYP